MTEQTARRSAKPIRERLTYANVTATLALFIALGGGAWAAVEIGRNDVTAREIAKGAVGSSELKNDKAKGKDVDESSLAEVPRADRANSAGTADTATTAQSAGQLDGLAPADLNAASSAFGNNPCDPGATTATCASTTLNQPRTSDVLVLATGSMFGTGTDVSGVCEVSGPEGTEAFAGGVEIGQMSATGDPEPHPNVDRGDGFFVPGLFGDVPAGPATFNLDCAQDTGDLKIGALQILAVRLSG